MKLLFQVVTFFLGCLNTPQEGGGFVITELELRYNHVREPRFSVRMKTVYVKTAEI